MGKYFVPFTRGVHAMKRYKITPTKKGCSVRSESSYIDNILYGISETFSELEISVDLSDDAVETLRSHKKVVDIEDMLDDLGCAIGEHCWANAVYFMGEFDRESFYKDGTLIEHHNVAILSGEEYIKAVSFHCPVNVEEIV
jgi:hypothetical protein